MSGNGNYEAALNAAQKLSNLDEESLLLQLGLRIEDSKNAGGPARAEHFEAQFIDFSPLQDASFLEEVGRCIHRHKTEPLGRIVGLS